MSHGSKKDRGQFYTTNADYILSGMCGPTPDSKLIVEPFAGKGDLIDWVKGICPHLPMEAYDIEPKRADIEKRDTLLHPPDYKDAWIITNPPYLARNKSSNKEVYNLYDTNDLYKCFIRSVLTHADCKGGIFIIPAGFFFSSRSLDVRCRSEFMTRYRITKVRYFEEKVFDDTTTTVVAFSFERSGTNLQEQDVIWEILPVGIEKVFRVSSDNNWIIGGEIYKCSIPANITIRRHVRGNKLREGEQQTNMTLCALDSGAMDGRICLEYKHGFVYQAKESSRTYATLRITGRVLTEDEQIGLCSEFNRFIEEKRTETWSLFLPQFRESKEYARKRIPFELAYRIILHLLPS